MILFEENTTGTATYIYGPTGTLAKRTTINQETNTFYYHTDWLGSTRVVTDSSKNTVSAVTYHPFGEPNTEEGSEHFLYTGKEKDSTGLYYYGARYYDPELGRFLTRDPKGGINRYSYCLNNPLKNIDPDGCESTNWLDDGSWLDENSPFNEKSDYVNAWVPGHAHIPEFVTWTVEDKAQYWGLACWFFAMVGVISIPLSIAYGGAVLTSVGSAIMGALKSIVGAVAALSSDVKLAIIEVILIIIGWIIEQTREINDPVDIELDNLYNDEGMLIGSIGRIDGGLGYEKGKVIFINDPLDPHDDTGYEYRYYEGCYQVLIDGEWVYMPEDWEPGDPVPSQP